MTICVHHPDRALIVGACSCGREYVSIPPHMLGKPCGYAWCRDGAMSMYDHPVSNCEHRVKAGPGVSLPASLAEVVDVE